MKRIFTALSALVVAACAEVPQMPAVVFENEDVVISQLAEGRWVFETADMVSMYLVEGSERAALIDTGTDVGALDSLVRLLTDKPLDVIITHWHYDHAGGVDYFPRVKMHAADTVLWHSGGVAGGGYDGEVEFLADGDVVDLGGVKLHVDLMPGHTPGSIILVDRAAGEVYTGDAFGSGQVWLQCQPALPLSTYRDSCRRMLKMMDKYRITKIFCGHYPHVKGCFGRDYVEAMEALAARLVEGGQSSVPFDNPRFPTARLATDSLSGRMIVFEPESVR